MECSESVPDIAAEYYIIPDDYNCPVEGERVEVENGQWIETGHKENNVKLVNRYRYTKLASGTQADGQIKDKQLPYDLEMSDFSEECEVEKLISVANLINNSLSRGTIHNYTTVIHRLRDFLRKSENTLSNLNDQLFFSWIMHLEKVSPPYSFWCKIKPAIEHLESIMDRQCSVLTKRNVMLLSGGKRFAAQKKPEIKKAIPIPPELLKKGIDELILPHSDDIMKVKGETFRALYKELLKFHCLGRFGDFAKLQAKHFHDLGDSLRIHFPFAKNDQHGKGNDNYIADDKTCYSFVKITRLYFKRFGLQFATEGCQDKNFVNFQLRVVREQDGSFVQIADGRKSLSRSQSFEDSKKLFKMLGYTESYSEKSAKMAGVKRAFEADGSASQIRDLGRWKTQDMPLHYLEQSKSYKENISRLVNL